MKLALAGPAAIALLARLWTGPHAIDDAYITFRYARNLAEGLGLVYNPGEWVLGTSAPLWAVLLGAGYRLGFTDLAWLATLVSAVCDAASVVLLIRFARRLGWQPLGAACVGLAWAINPMSIAFATGGMETSLFVLISLVVLGLTATRRHLPLAAFVAGLATLVRPEGVLLLAVVLGWTWATARRQALLTGLCGLAPSAAAGLTLWWRYGSPLPNSVAAKQVAYQAGWPLENAVALLLQAGLPGWSTFLLAVVPSAMSLMLASIGLLGLVELSRRSLPWLTRQAIPWQPFAAFGMLYVAFYVIVGLRGVRLFPWYLVPLAPLYLLAASAGLARLATRRAVALAAIVVLWQVPAIDWHRPLLPAGENLDREAALLDVGHALGSSLLPTALVAAPEIGALGYASNLKMLDTVGLVSPAALTYYPLSPDQLVTDNAVPPRLIDALQPDVVVTLDAFARRSLLPDLAFQHAYSLDRSLPVQVWQSQQLWIFRRIAAPRRAAANLEKDPVSQWPPS
jgi:arabinofuranosyltransferase